MAKFPKHFKEPIRIEMAVLQIQHELRKLFPSLPYSMWPLLDRDVSNWFFGEKFELEPIFDFWNFFGAFTRELKMKSIEAWITAANVEWTKHNLSVDEIIMTWDFPGLEFIGKAPFRVSDLTRRLNHDEMLAVKKKVKENSHKRSQKYAPRDHYPITVFYDEKGGVINSYAGYYILDGNRRVVKAVVEDRETIEAYIGKFKNDADLWPEDYWLPAGIMRDLIFLAEKLEKENDTVSFNLLRLFFQLLLREFDIARIAMIEKSFKNFETSQKLILDIITEDMKCK